MTRYDELFSKRYGLRPTSEGLLYEIVPEQARIGLYYVIEKYFGEMNKRQHSYSDLYKELCVALRIFRNKSFEYISWEGQALPFLQELVTNCEWWQFYDISLLFLQQVVMPTRTSTICLRKKC